MAHHKDKYYFVYKHEHHEQWNKINVPFAIIYDEQNNVINGQYISSMWCNIKLEETQILLFGLELNNNIISEYELTNDDLNNIFNECLISKRTTWLFDKIFDNNQRIIWNLSFYLDENKHVMINCPRFKLFNLSCHSL